jgi:hypothetical protein
MGIEPSQHLARRQIIARDIIATRRQVSFFFIQSVIGCTVCQAGLAQMDNSFDKDMRCRRASSRMDGRHDKDNAILASLIIGCGPGKEISGNKRQSHWLMVIKKGGEWLSVEQWSRRTGVRVRCDCVMAIKKGDEWTSVSESQYDSDQEMVTKKDQWLSVEEWSRRIRVGWDATV